MAQVVTVECPRCRRPVAELLGRDGTIRAASGGSVREEQSADGTPRYRVACTGRKHRPEVRTWTAATIDQAYRAYYWATPRVSMADIRRGVKPRSGGGDGGPRGLHFGNGRVVRPGGAGQR